MEEDHSKKILRVCFFGNYNPQYIRTAVILKGLRDNDVEVIECNDRRRNIYGYFAIVKKLVSLCNKYDILIVGNETFSRTYVLFAKLLTNKIVVWDAHYSLFDAWAYDRMLISKWSLKGRYHWCMDWFATFSADLVYLDTPTHADYFAKLFYANKKKFFYSLVGADDKMFRPVSEQNHSYDKFVVEFHGKFIPLQGIEFIVEAAKLLEDDSEIIFKIIGNGQTHRAVMERTHQLRVTNITFIDKVPYQEIPNLIREADVCLGIFGKTPKAQRVIPNKLYEAVAMGKPVITARTPAIADVFTDRVNMLFCEVANAKDLAEKIRDLKNNPILMKMISKNVYELYKARLTPQIIGRNLCKVLLNAVELKKN